MTIRPNNPNTQTWQSEGWWMLFVAPLLWLTHLVATYLTASYWCQREATDGGLSALARALVGVYTAIALAGIGGVGWWGRRRCCLPGDGTPTDDSEPPSVRQVRRLGLATVIIALASALATLAVAIGAPQLGRCA